jgi:hypothetical protein
MSQTTLADKRTRLVEIAIELDRLEQEQGELSDDIIEAYKAFNNRLGLNLWWGREEFDFVDADGNLNFHTITHYNEYGEGVVIPDDFITNPKAYEEILRKEKEALDLRALEKEAERVKDKEARDHAEYLRLKEKFEGES